MCNMMGAMALHDSISEIEKRGFIGALEPACGSGAMILGFAKAMLDADLNYGSQLVVLATDIDIKCTHMCFVQLSLYGIPAIVTHGNTITCEEYSRWYTPFYVLDGWHRRQK